MSRAGLTIASTIVPPPATCRASSLVLTAVLSLALAGAAHALSVDIVVPDTDPADVYQHLRAPFLAVCRDEKGNDVSDRATFTWSFPAAKEPTVGNPATHRFPKLGKFLVSVTATLEKDCGSDQITVNVVELVATRALPSAGDFELFIRIPQGDPLDPEACDDVEVVCQSKIAGRWPLLPFEWCNTKFYKWVDNDWEFMGEDNPGMYDDVRWSSYITWHTVADPNAAVEWKAEMYLYDMMDPPGDPHHVFPYLTAYFTPNNTVVKATGDEIILHHAEDTSHTIAWDITHCEDVDPTFTVTVTIYDLAGNLVATLVEEDVELGEGSTHWDEDLPEEHGIYTYKIVANHHDMAPPMGPCEDRDKSWQLGITSVSVSDFVWIDLPTTAQVTLHYDLSRGAADCALSVYDPDLSPIGSAQLSAQSGSHQYTVTWTDSPGIAGPYRFVVSALESAADGAANRDAEQKPALQRGAVEIRHPRAENYVWTGYSIPLISAYEQAIHDLRRYDAVYTWYEGEQPLLTRAELEGYSDRGFPASALMVFKGHGNAGFAEALHNEDANSTASIYAKRHGGMTQWDMAVDDHAGSWSHLRLVAWLTCHSAEDSIVGNLLHETIYTAGAACSLGIDGGSPQTEMCYWAERFMYYACVEAESLSMAFTHADQDAEQHFYPNYSGLIEENRRVFGCWVDLAPAGYGAYYQE